MYTGIQHLVSVCYDFLTIKYIAVTDSKIIKLNKNMHCDKIFMVNLIFGIRPI